MTTSQLEGGTLTTSSQVCCACVGKHLTICVPATSDLMSFTHESKKAAWELGEGTKAQFGTEAQFT